MTTLEPVDYALLLTIAASLTGLAIAHRLYRRYP